MAHKLMDAKRAAMAKFIPKRTGYAGMGERTQWGLEARAMALGTPRKMRGTVLQSRR
jgi:hypothetical protein